MSSQDSAPVTTGPSTPLDLATQPLLDHRRGQVAAGPLDQRTSDIRRTTQSIGHAVWVIERGEGVDDGVHDLQQSLSGCEIPGSQFVEQSPAALAHRLTEPVEIWHRIHTEIVVAGKRFTGEHGGRERRLREFLGGVVGVSDVEQFGVCLGRLDDRLVEPACVGDQIRRRYRVTAMEVPYRVCRRPDDLATRGDGVLSGGEAGVELWADRRGDLIEPVGHSLTGDDTDRWTVGRHGLEVVIGDPGGLALLDLHEHAHVPGDGRVEGEVSYEPADG